MSDEELIRRLQDAAAAYPVDVFPEPTDHDREHFADVVTRASAGMGRHFSPLFTAAADAIARRLATPPPDAVREAVEIVRDHAQVVRDPDTQHALRLILDHFKEQCDD